jgi:drug/metabolite transporter (DMT)-like permease
MPSRGRNFSGAVTLPANATAPAMRPGHALANVAAGAVLISFAPVWVRVADVGPTAAGVYRMLIGGIVLLALALARRERLWVGRRAMAFVVVGAAFFSADLVFWHRSIDLVGPGLATILANFQVFLLAGFGVVVLRERLGWRLAVAIPAALLGLFLLVGIDWNSLPASYRAGVVFGLLTALSYGSYLLVLRASQRRTAKLAPVPTLMAICWVTTLMLVALAAVERESIGIPNLKSGVVLVVYGVTAQAAGWLLILRGIAHVEAGRAGLVLLLQPSLAFVWDILFFARPTSAIDVAGALLALAAIHLGATGRARGGATGA